MPPLGALFPAKQDSTLTVETTLVELAAKADCDLPAGFQVLSGSNIYGWTGSSWEDGNTSDPVTDANLSGSIIFRNPAAYDVGVTW